MRTARQLPPDRIEFYMLSYYQLRACKSAGEKWREYEEWAARNLPAPVAVIRSKVKNEGKLPPAWWAKWRRLQE